MKKLLILILLCAVNAHAASKAKLWATVSVSESLFQEEDFGFGDRFYFALVNDGPRSVETRIFDSHLMLNGQALKNLNEIVPVRAAKKTLEPGEVHKFSCNLDEAVAKPGIYRLRWFGSNFSAPEITFRVLPLREPVPAAIALVRRIRPTLPKGWRVSYDTEHHWLQINRRETVMQRPSGINLSGFEKPQPTLIWFAFRTQPLIAPAEWRRQAARNDEINQQASALYRDLDKQKMNRKFDYFLPTTPEQKAQVDQYDQLKKSRVPLPQFFFRDISLSWQSPGNDWSGMPADNLDLNDPDITPLDREWHRAFHAAIVPLSRYQAAPEVVKGQP